jgi:hypothetical protein
MKSSRDNVLRICPSIQLVSRARIQNRRKRKYTHSAGERLNPFFYHGMKPLSLRRTEYRNWSQVSANRDRPNLATIRNDTASEFLTL